MRGRTLGRVVGGALVMIAAVASGMHRARADPPAAEGGVVESGIRIVKDLPYAANAEPRQTLDLYLPERPAGRLPVVILIHGGGWNAGDKESFGGVAREFVRRGYAAASLNYRYSRQATFPAQVVDGKSAIRWLRAHAGAYHLDPDRFAAGGHSAGGHLAAFLGVSNGDGALDRGEDLGETSDVQAVLWFAGVGDLLARVKTPGYESEAAPGSGQSLLIGGAVLENPEKAAAASPVLRVSAASAPFFLAHGDADRLVPVAQAVAMDRALRDRGVLSELHVLPGVDHGGPAYFAPDMMDQIDAFLDRALKMDPRWIAGRRLADGAYTLSPVDAPGFVLVADRPAGPGRSVVGLDRAGGPAGRSWTFARREDGTYRIAPPGRPSAALTVAGAGTKDGTLVTIEPDAGTPAQSWRVVKDRAGGTCALIPRCSPASGLDDFGGRASPEAVVDIWTYAPGDSHLQWAIAPAPTPTR